MDAGCHVGAAENRALPWSRGEALPALDGRHLLRNISESYLSSHLRQCVIVADRHVHKNGGSTVRDLFLEHERQGYALYMGYEQVRWSEDYRTLRHAAERASASSLRHRALLVEAHLADVPRSEFADWVVPGLRDLSAILAARYLSCPLVLTTRVREPLDFYLSFYRWGIGFRQRDSPSAYGSSFAEWAERVPNLQSTVMMRSAAAYHAEYAPRRYRALYEQSKEVGRTPRAAWRRLRGFLDGFALVGTVERFDETMLLLHDATGLPLLLYKRNTPRQKNGYVGRNRDVCPNLDVCRRLVRRVAPRDHMMYDRYRKRLEAKLVELGPSFTRRVADYKRAVAATQALWRRVPRRQSLCRFQDVRRASRRAAAMAAAGDGGLRCPFGAPTPWPAPSATHNVTADAVGGEAERAADAAVCASVYAHRQFECPWQYEPNSSLTDELGCWRPSSGVK